MSIEDATQRAQETVEAAVSSRIYLNPFGEWLVDLAGVIGVGIGGYQFYRSWKADFRSKLRLHEM